MKEFAKLICEYNCVLLMKVNNKKLTKEKMRKELLTGSIEALYNAISDAILRANLTKEHFYRFDIQVHAQKRDDIK